MNPWITYLLVSYFTMYGVIKYSDNHFAVESDAMIGVVLWIISPIYFWALIPYEVVLSIAKNFTLKEKS